MVYVQDSTFLSFIYERCQLKTVTFALKVYATSVSLFYDLLNPPSLVLLLFLLCEHNWSATLVTPMVGQLKI